MKVAQRASCAFPNEKLQATQTVLSAEKFYDYAEAFRLGGNGQDGTGASDTSANGSSLA
jgi:hypothetical protein